MWGRKREEGQSVVELALILPLLIVLLAITFDLGRALMYYADVVHAAREGAWVASAQPWNTGAIRRAVTDVLIDSGMDPTRMRMDVTHGPDARIQVTVRYSYEPILPLPITNLSLVASHTMRLRR